MSYNATRIFKAPVLLVLLMLLLCAAIFKTYLLFHNVYFFKSVGSDTLNYNYPFEYHVAEYIARYGVPGWSFGMGMGQSLFPFFLRDPFDIFLYIAGKDHIVTGTLYKEVAKILLTGLVFYYYFRSLKLTEYASAAGGLFTAFCGFMVLGSCWYVFSFEVFNVALLLLACERLRDKRSWWLFPLAIFLTCLSEPFNLFPYGLFMIFYMVLRAVQTGTLTARNIAILLLRMGMLALLGMLLCAPFLIENVARLLDSPRGSANEFTSTLSRTPVFSLVDKIQAGVCIMRMFATDMLGTSTAYNAFRNYLEAPLFYCSLPCLLLLPQYFTGADRRHKLLLLGLLMVWLLPCVFPYLRYALWAFVANYYRIYSFFVAFLLIYFSVAALDMVLKGKRLNVPVLCLTVAGLFVLLYYPHFSSNPAAGQPKVSVREDIRRFVSIMLVVYAALIYLLGRRETRTVGAVVLMLAIITELVWLNQITVNDMEAATRTDLTAPNGYADHTVEAVKYLERTDSSFYRIDKTFSSSPAYFPSYNDGMAQGYYGTSSYNSFNEAYYVRYLQLMGITSRTDESESRWAVGLTNHPMLEAENRVKYVLTKGDVPPALRLTADSIYTAGDVKVFRNRYVLPFGFAYKFYARQSEFDKLPPARKEAVTLHACVLNDSDVAVVSAMKELSLNDMLPADTAAYRQCADELAGGAMTVTAFSNKLVKGTVTAGVDEMVYLSIPYDNDWALTVDGKPHAKTVLDGGMTGVMIPSGRHTIQMAFAPRFAHMELLLAALGVLIYAGGLFYSLRRR